MKKTALVMTFALGAFPAFGAEKQGCDPLRSTRGVIVMDDGDLLRFKEGNHFDYSADKGKNWRDLTTSGAWPTMDGRTLTVKDGKFISLE